MHHVNVSWDPLLIALSYIISVFGSYTALRLAVKIPAAPPDRLPRWLVAAALAMGGCAIWSMHFIGMLAYKIDMPITYNPQLTILSMIIGIMATGAGLYWVGRSDGNWGPLFTAGVFTGLGVAGMHYTGMAAMQMAGRMVWDMTLVGLSIVIAIVASCVALWLAFHLRGLWQRIGSALVMGLAICGMHYTGMAAMGVEMSEAMPTSAAVEPGFNTIQLALTIFFTSAVILTIGLFATGRTQDEELVFEI
jgi:NO-binding membrane sensor protein with MHYT domain